MNNFISKTFGIEDSNVIFDNKLGEIEYKEKDVSTIMQKLHIQLIFCKLWCNKYKLYYCKMVLKVLG